MSIELTTPIKIEIPGIGTIESADLYLKSEADKVIEDLEVSKIELIKAWVHRCTVTEERERRQKYTRCLAMAF